MKHHFKFTILSILILGLCSDLLKAIDNPHFYRALFFWGEPRFEKKWLNSFDVSLAGGYTNSAYNQEGTKTSLLDIYGPQNAQELGENNPNLNPSNPFDKILIDLAALPKRNNFGQLAYSGKFYTLEGVINEYQNIARGFFFQCYVPIRTLQIHHINYSDLSPNDSSYPNKNTPEWQSFLDNFNVILQQFGFSTGPTERTGVGDVSVLVGWTINYEKTEKLDYIDVDAKLGGLFPSAKTKDPYKPFDLPLGYDGFFGFPLHFDLSIGALDWFTAGFHLDALFFFERNKTLAMKTAADQNGFIKLTVGQAKVEQGTIWDVMVFVKADHFSKGGSIILGYDFSHQDQWRISPFNTTLFDPAIVNTDQAFKSWTMNVFHIIGEYDFTNKVSPYGPRISLYYNRVINGKRIFDTSMIGTSIGVDVQWCF